MSMKQLTLAILKPDVQRFINYRKYIESVMSDAQLQIIHNEEIFMTRDRAQVFYAEHKADHLECIFLPVIMQYLFGVHCSAPLKFTGKLGVFKYFFILSIFRTVVFEPNSLRGRFGLTDTRNGFHGSDSQENAFKEIKFFFPNFNCESILSDL
ncbi:nucleoside-diphosphate kinase [Schistosoma bovis]|uniref:Nucleoside-diphosphate kinase n=1 Tax=Schistosoma bovis TaxID=6184 RepID=A0A430Q7V8_SCHBO|nr:nucleoside-diphosphate kinase [Schistosoma bovis]